LLDIVLFIPTLLRRFASLPEVIKLVYLYDLCLTENVTLWTS